MVLDRGQNVQPDRDYAFEKATWGLQATPVLGVAMLVFAIVALGRLVQRLVDRLTQTRRV